ncbi:hypothetical protein RJ639_025639 [Escallonia herrerae]|uniref:Uncharacterized protein n=1 Tax=Escallonia herrerae TaxID=1293975 RepID=A0AA89ABS4_9ASTE|nr:hypothetical protein RJ639_025639 [Escallonia herrerae]
MKAISSLAVAKSSQLRCLRLVRCHDSFSSEAFIEAIEKLPLLEDIHIHYATISKEAVAAAGRCCPMLKSFKLNKKAYKIPDFECDDEALAIAGSMPGLRYLQLIGSKITNRGLQAILDKCPHLEYLDLRQCLNLRLEGNMGKLCSERIKDFRHPNDSTDDYEFATSVCRIY